MTTASPLVSVIVPTHNSARTLEACVRSIKAQSHEPLELIVVDNESTDATVEIALTFASIVERFGNERSAQRNRGAELASGEYLLFIDSDMTLEPRVVSECIDVIGRTGAPAAIIPETSVGEGFVARCRALERSCYEGDDSVEAARFYPTKVFRAHGGFDESLSAFEDWDLSNRVGGSRTLPRTSVRITHHEGELRLTTLLAKKRYYGAASLKFVRKHGRGSISRGNIVFRPAFLRNWRRLAWHPLLTVGFISIKCLESLAGMWGLIQARLARTPPGVNRRFN
jgi:glycosyltransferase involved in cell wall biosynthesis